MMTTLLPFALLILLAGIVVSVVLKIMQGMNAID